MLSKMVQRNRQTIASIVCVLFSFLTNVAPVSAASWPNSTSVFRLLPQPPSQSPITTSDAHSTQCRATSAAAGIGNFVAAGFGMTRSTSAVVEEEFLVATSSSARESHESALTSSTTTAPVVTNATNSVNLAPSFTGDCWGQWTSYWSLNLSASNALTTVYISATSTISETLRSYSGTTERISGLTTVSAKNGVFAQTTFVTVMELSRNYIYTSFSPWTTSVSTFTYGDRYVSNILGNHTITPPSCILPSHIPQCQSSWEDWVSGKLQTSYPQAPAECSSYVHNRVSLQPSSCRAPLSALKQARNSFDSAFGLPRPICTQASVPGAACSSFIDHLLDEATSYNEIINGVVVLNTMLSYTTTDASGRENTIYTQSTMPWNASSSVVPGCTLGCHSCQINGGTVQLIFWAPSSSTWIDGRYSAIDDADKQKRSVVTLGTTLNSPTVYVSFDSLFARDSCSMFSKTHFDKIVAITRASNLSSLWGQNTYNSLPSTASFNFTDL